MVGADGVAGNIRDRLNLSLAGKATMDLTSGSIPLFGRLSNAPFLLARRALVRKQRAERKMSGGKEIKSRSKAKKSAMAVKSAHLLSLNGEAVI